MYSVYCHRNKFNGFEYIGMTSRSVKKRWSGGAARYVNCKNFEQALREFGWDGFEHLVLYDNLTKEEASAKETELIRKNIAKGISYNVREDNDWIGNLRKRPVDVYDLSGILIETCESIHAVSEKYKTAETHAYYCAVGKKKTIHNKYILAFHGESLGERLLESNIDRRHEPAHNRRKIVMMSLEGEIIRTFDSATEASNYVSASVSSIVICCSGKLKTCKGFKWCYA